MARARGTPTGSSDRGRAPPRAEAFRDSWTEDTTAPRIRPLAPAAPITRASSVWAHDTQTEPGVDPAGELLHASQSLLAERERTIAALEAELLAARREIERLRESGEDEETRLHRGGAAALDRSPTPEPSVPTLPRATTGRGPSPETAEALARSKEFDLPSFATEPSSSGSEWAPGPPLVPLPRGGAEPTPFGPLSLPPPSSWLPPAPASAPAVRRVGLIALVLLALLALTAAGLAYARLVREPSSSATEKHVHIDCNDAGGRASRRS